MQPWTEPDQPPSDILDEIAHASRLLGADPTLVLHGGGNTSVKLEVPDATGAMVRTLYAKGSGHDLATIGRDGFAPVRLDRLTRLLPPTRVSDAALKNELLCALTDADAPAPSVESLVHAFIPYPVVLHSHADVILAMTNTDDGEHRIRSVYGSSVIVVPYAMPGVDLAVATSAAWREQHTADTIGIVVLGHGVFTFGGSAREAYQCHVALIDAAEAYLATHAAPVAAAGADLPSPDHLRLARLRRRICDAAGVPMVLRRHAGPVVSAFVGDPELLAAAARGPLTPDHVIWTKRLPLIGTDVDAYADAYAEYVAANASRRGTEPTMLDPAPRVVLDRELGMLTAGRTAVEAVIAGDIYRHTMDAIVVAESLGGYRALPAEHVFDLEYWEPQQDKLRRADRHLPLSGRIAVVTGAASGIGRACAAALLDAGASVVGWDLSEAVTTAFDSPEWLGLRVDVTDGAAMADAVREGVAAFGGLDMLVVAAGIFPSSAPLGEMSMEVWTRVLSVNASSVAELYGLAHPLLATAPGGGDVVLIASKNVAAPGPGAAAYSSSKAAVVQLSRVAALEWAGDGIRVNMVHPDAVFDTGLWTPELLAARAERYGLDVEAYKRRNLLHTEVTSAAVGRMVLAMVDGTFACTTGAQVPIDGGNERVI